MRRTASLKVALVAALGTGCLFPTGCGGTESVSEPTRVTTTTTPVPSTTESTPTTTRPSTEAATTDQDEPTPAPGIGGVAGNPSCDAATLAGAWNAKFEGDYPLDLGPYELTGPACDGDIAIGFVSQTRDDLGNPDFGQAVFVAGPDGWTAVTRLRTPLCSNKLDLVEMHGMTPEAAETALTLMNVRDC